MKKEILSLLFHSASRRGCSLVVNLKPFCSFINTAPGGTEDPRGETTLQMPINSIKCWSISRRWAISEAKQVQLNHFTVRKQQNIENRLKVCY